MKLCFVAKDEEEFGKYLRGIDFVGGLERFPREMVPSILKEPLCRASIDCGIYKIDPEIEFEWASLLASGAVSRNLRIYVMMNARQKDKDNIRDNLGSSDKQKSTARLTFLQDIELCMTRDGGDEFDADTFLFIHWGGGDPLWYEEQFQPFCDAHPETAKGLRAFALSSRRYELFNVTASKIILPKTEEAAHELVASFSFARIKDLMAEYLVAYFSNLKEEQECTGHPFPITDKRLLWPLQSFFNAQKNRLEMQGSLSDIDKRRLETLRYLVGLDWEKETQLPYEEETAELFAALIRSKGRV